MRAFRSQYLKMASLQLGRTLIQRNGRDVYIIAEIGQNHQGSLEVAKLMIKEARDAGCNCVKFQKSCLEEKFTKSALRRTYNDFNSWGKSYGEHKAFLEFSFEQYLELKEYSRSIGIDFTASAMDEVSLYQLDLLNVPFIKIGSGDANNFPLLEKAAKLQRPIIISTGMQTATTIERIKRIMSDAKKSNYGIMHCVSSYPTKPEDCQLNKISWLRQIFPHLVIGYSGHEVGIQITQAAVLIGARVVERHFTLDNSLKGSDHKCSLEPRDMKQMVLDLKNLMSSSIIDRPLTSSEVFSLLGNTRDVIKALQICNNGKIIEDCEINCRKKLGKSLVTKKALNPGHVICRDDLKVKVSEPNGIWAEYIDEVVGLQLLQYIDADYPLLWEYVRK
ncbi:sialic acid synthase isoform X1 [Stomoxys calcitrans]|uniref:sialic acid synthase isoform X1 n=1 Tax=Stomoxys calcitrans TaxID=35570 RepID=UPI0027E25CF0|nr:sialic acid synthase isoform X1 [Stomoxys calcitrans]